jgi:hypothetical protein
MRFAAKDSIQPLPPLEPEQPEDELDDDSVGSLITPLEEEAALDDDDDEPLTDPDLGIEPPSEAGLDEPEAAAELDVGPDFGLVEDDAADARDDGESLERSFSSLLSDDLKESPADATEDRDGIDDATPLLNDLELPEIDADEHGADHTPHLFGSLPTAEESLLAFAERPWPITRLAPERERCAALAAARGAVVAGSTDLLWLDAARSAPVRIALDGTRIASLALVGEDGDLALAVTAFGRLVRRSRLASDAERLGDWRRVAESGGSAESLQLCQVGPSAPRSVVGRLTSGKLVRSDDDGNGFQPLDTGFTAFALSPTGDPIAALTRDGAELQLSNDGGRSWSRRDLVTHAREVAGGEAPLLATSGSTLLIADRERGLVLSTDAGLTFRQVEGCAGVTACCAGSRDDQAMAWAALYREASDETWLVQIEAASGRALVIARIETSDDADPEQGSEAARLDRLLWDGQRLFGAGDAGFLRLEPPADDG